MTNVPADSESNRVAAEVVENTFVPTPVGGVSWKTLPSPLVPPLTSFHKGSQPHQRSALHRAEPHRWENRGKSGDGFSLHGTAGLSQLIHGSGAISTSDPLRAVEVSGLIGNKAGYGVHGVSSLTRRMEHRFRPESRLLLLQALAGGCNDIRGTGAIRTTTSTLVP